MENEFYILCENPYMLSSIVEAHDMLAWLEQWWQTPLLVTTSIYTVESWRYGLVNGLYPHTRYDLKKFKEFKGLVNGRCYSIGNGLTLALAMHRVGMFRGREFTESLFKFLQQHDFDNLYQQVLTPWVSLYYGHPTQHVADFPWYYVCSGPQFADPSVLYMMLPAQTEGFPQIVRGNHIAMTSYRSAMLPYIAPNIWINIGNIYVGEPDIYGYMTAIFCSRRVWKWWLQKQQQAFKRWLHFGFLPNIMISTFLLYNKGSDNGNVTYSRIAAVWKQLLGLTDISDITTCVTRFIDHVPYRFMKLLHDEHMMTTELLSLQRANNHVFYKKTYEPMVLSRLCSIYEIFGLGLSRKNKFVNSETVGQLVLAHFKDNPRLISY
jgi:hypothetical protein